MGCMLCVACYSLFGQTAIPNGQMVAPSVFKNYFLSVMFHCAWWAFKSTEVWLLMLEFKSIPLLS